MFKKNRFFNLKTYEQTKNLKKRVPSSFIFVTIVLLLLALSWWSDPLSLNTDKIKFSWLAFISEKWAQGVVPYAATVFIILCSLIPFQLVYEITRSSFLHIWSRSKYLVFSFLVLLGSTLCNLIYLPMIFFDIKAQAKIPFLSPIIFFSSTIIFNIILFIVAKVIINNDYANTKFNKRQFPITMVMISMFILSLEYTGLNHSWSSMFILVAIPVTSDVFAYLGGSLFGVHKMAPIVSPKKSWEGCMIGFILALGISLCFLYLFSLYHPSSQSPRYLFSPSNLFFGYSMSHTSVSQSYTSHIIWWLLVGSLIICLCVLSVLGDLYFSWIKRRNFIKDYSSFINGHGGLLDRVDSLMFVVVTYGLFTIVSSFVTGIHFHNDFMFPTLTNLP